MVAQISHQQDKFGQMELLILLKFGMIEQHIHIVKMEDKYLKIIFGIAFVILIGAGVAAYQYNVIYNPYTQKLDYYTTANFTGHNLTADNFVGGDGSFDNIYNKSQVDELVGSLTLNLFFHNFMDAELSSFYVMNETANTYPQAQYDFTVTGNDFPLGNFTSKNASEIGITGLSKGVYDGHFHSNATIAGKKAVYGFWKLYIRQSNGTETLVGTSYLQKVTTLTEGEYDAHLVVVNEHSLNDDDKLFVKMYANVSGTGGDPDLSVHIDGDTASRFQFSVTGIHFATNEDLNNYLRNDGDTATGNYSFDSGTFFVDSNNNRVGIGTTTPIHPLSVFTNTNDRGIQLVTTGGTSLIDIMQQSTDAGRMIMRDGGTIKIDMNSNANGNTYFNTGGKFGIGTSSPTHELNVVGSMNVTQNITTEENLIISNGTIGVTHWNMYEDINGTLVWEKL